MALRAGLVLLVAHWAFFLYIGCFSLLYRVVDPPLTALMVHRALVAGHALRPLRPVALESLPRSVPRMFVKVEDYVFYEHFGIDWKAIQDAYHINRRLGYVYYGGSTITQQLARTLFLVPDRTYLRKYLEAVASVEMEILLPKDRILELYVNTIEFGKGVFGLGAAAEHYYGRSAQNLERDQYRRLVALVASPLRYNVNTLSRSRALAERYRYLSAAFPDGDSAGATPGVGEATEAAQQDGEPVPQGAEVPAAGEPAAVTDGAGGVSGAGAPGTETPGAGAPADSSGSGVQAGVEVPEGE